MIDARKYLENLRDTEISIDIKMKQILSLREKLERISVSMDQELVSHTRNAGIMADTVAMIVDLQKSVDAQSAGFLREKKKAYHLMDQIQPESATILMNHYFEGKSTIDLAKALYVSRRHAQRKLKEALDEFQVVLNESDETGTDKLAEKLSLKFTG